MHIYSVFWTILWVGDGLPPSTMAVCLLLVSSSLTSNTMTQLHGAYHQPASKAFIEAICPALSQYKRVNEKHWSKGAGSDGEHSDDNKLEWLANLAHASGSPIDADMEIDEEWTLTRGPSWESSCTYQSGSSLLTLVLFVAYPVSIYVLCTAKVFSQLCPRGRIKTLSDQVDLYLMGVYVWSHRPCAHEPCVTSIHCSLLS